MNTWTLGVTTGAGGRGSSWRGGKELRRRGGEGTPSLVTEGLSAWVMSSWRKRLENQALSICKDLWARLGEGQCMTAIGKL